MPFPSTHVIHPRWAAANRPAAVGSLTGTCTITAPTGAADWQPGAGGTSTTPVTLYTGPCGLSDLARSGQARDVAGQAVAPGRYLLGIDPTTGPIPVGARVHVTGAPDNPDLAGAWLTVASDSHGTTTLERALTCDLDPANQG